MSFYKLPRSKLRNGFRMAQKKGLRYVAVVARFKEESGVHWPMADKTVPVASEEDLIRQLRRDALHPQGHPHYLRTIFDTSKRFDTQYDAAVGAKWGDTRLSPEGVLAYQRYLAAQDILRNPPAKPGLFARLFKRG